jgi:uncharacterized protein
MSGGNWKDLLKAAGAGNLQLVQHHLQQNDVDPNFQHPEYFTSPVFEAIRGGQLEALQLLVKYGGSPKAKEESTDCTPLEVAMQSGQHDIVDYLLTILSDDVDDVATNVRPYLKRVVLPLSHDSIPDSTMRLLQIKVLELGHDLYLLQNGGASSSPIMMDGKKNADASALVEELKTVTHNSKVTVVPSFESFDEEEDINIIHFATATASDDDDLESAIPPPHARLVIVFNDSGMKFCQTFLQENNKSKTTTAAIPLYDSWLDRLTARWWIGQWIDTVVWMATESDDDEVCGTIHPYNQYHLNQRPSLDSL